MMPKPAEKTQIEKFRETARALESNEDESKFNDALKRVAKAPPPRALPKEPENPEKADGA